MLMATLGIAMDTFPVISFKTHKTVMIEGTMASLPHGEPEGRIHLAHGFTKLGSWPPSKAKVVCSALRVFLFPDRTVRVLGEAIQRVWCALLCTFCSRNLLESQNGLGRKEPNSGSKHSPARVRQCGCHMENDSDIEGKGSVSRIFI